jgi:predicted phage terminase large subunit-like protein
LLGRAQANRLYVVTAPSYQMLSDSTFRSLLEVGEMLSIIDSVHRSTPPSCTTKTGAEILQRSADEPHRLRGTTLAGVWMDEASLCPHELFRILLARLRQGGQLGWLSATFTPKGRLHWSHQVFNTGQPDTALIRCRTADNTFLHKDFDATTRAQYTSQLAAQELDAEFLDSGGTMFKTDWFAIVDSTPPLLHKCRAWDLASTPKSEKDSDERGPDFTAGVLLGRDKDNTYYILDIRRARNTPKEIEKLVRHTAERDGYGVPVYCEQEPGSSGVALIDHLRRDVLPGYIFYGVRSTGPKAARAQPLAAAAEGQIVKLVRGPWNQAFLDECEMFPFSNFDDQLDAAALAYNKLSAVREVIGTAPLVLTPARVDPFGDGIPGYGGPEFAPRQTGALGYGQERYQNDWIWHAQYDMMDPFLGLVHVPKTPPPEPGK